MNSLEKMTVCRPRALVSSCLARALNSKCSRHSPLVMNLSWTMPRVPTVGGHIRHLHACWALLGKKKRPQGTYSQFRSSSAGHLPQVNRYHFQPTVDAPSLTFQHLTRGRKRQFPERPPHIVALSDVANYPFFDEPDWFRKSAESHTSIGGLARFQDSSKHISRWHNSHDNVNLSDISLEFSRPKRPSGTI